MLVYNKRSKIALFLSRIAMSNMEIPMSHPPNIFIPGRISNGGHIQIHSIFPQADVFGHFGRRGLFGLPLVIKSTNIIQVIFPKRWSGLVGGHLSNLWDFGPCYPPKKATYTSRIDGSRVTWDVPPGCNRWTWSSFPTLWFWIVGFQIGRKRNHHPWRPNRSPNVAG